VASIHFYRLRQSDWAGADRLARSRDATAAYQVELWRPSLAHPFPPGRTDPRILCYTAFHVVGAFANPCYSAIVLRDANDRIVHSSLVMPKFARFPFMGPRDLQIGATHTREDQRGRGLAVRAIDEIVKRYSEGGRAYWYLTDSTNAASIAVIRKAGFTFVGTGIKYPRLGLRFLGYYRLQSSDNLQQG
jgi:RimJ/RimL family protein N-acetyltransferase